MNFGSIVGNVVADPIRRETSQGVPVLNFSVADNRQFTNAAGETVEEVSFHDVVLWRGLAENANATLKKGMRVVVTGRWEQSQYEVEVNGEPQKRSRHRLIGQACGPDLLWATAQITKTAGATAPAPAPAPEQTTLPEGEPIAV